MPGVLGGFEAGLLYTALGVLGGAAAVGARVASGRRPGRALRRMLLVAVAVLTLLLLAVASRTGRPPVGNRPEILLTAAWLLCLGATLVDRRFRAPIVSAVAAPTAGVLVLFAAFLVPRAQGVAPDPSPGQYAHIVLAVLGLGALAFAAVVAGIYLWQIRQVKRHPATAVRRRLPSLATLDRVNFVAVAAGCPLLALSVVAGWLFIASQAAGPGSWWLDPTVLATLSGLLVYVVLFGARAFLGWYGRRVAWLTVAGFLVFVIGYVVADFCTSTSAFHS